MANLEKAFATKFKDLSWISRMHTVEADSYELS